jgi:fructose-1-phosphate kinase PfkB-like protein
MRAASALPVVAAATVLLAACGSSTSSGTTGLPSSSAGWSIAQARANYLADVAPSKRDGTRLIAKGHVATPSNWTKFRDICKVTAADEDTLVRKLAAGAWPASVKPKVAAMITALNTERATYHACAAAQTSAEVVAAMSNPVSVRPAADAVRIALGLPPVS